MPTTVGSESREKVLDSESPEKVLDKFLLLSFFNFLKFFITSLILIFIKYYYLAKYTLFL